jgi:hypothetical protein
MMAPESFRAILACVDLWPFMTILLLDCLTWPSRSSRVPKKKPRSWVTCWRKQIERPATNMSNGPGASPSLHILAPASRGRESKMPLHRRNKKVVATRTQYWPPHDHFPFCLSATSSRLIHASEPRDRMSEMGPKQTFVRVHGMSVLVPIGDIDRAVNSLPAHR